MMLDVRLRALGIAILAALAGCFHETEESPDRLAFAEAVKLQNAMDLEGAIVAYRNLLRVAEDPVIKARADLELLKIETAMTGRDEVLSRLKVLPTELDVKSLHSVEDEIVAILTAASQGPFADDIQVAARQALARARAEDLAARERETADIRLLIESGEYQSAILKLREVERRRLPDDRTDIVELLVVLRKRSDEDVLQVIEKYLEKKTAASATAAPFLVETMPRFRGTRAYARILELQLGEEKIAAEEEKEDGDLDDSEN